MATTRLNTRIRIRYDDYANWMRENPVLLKGEMAVTIVPSTTADANYPETGNTIPEYRNVQQNKDTVLIKVGDGTTAYRNLPFATGRAGDVYDWAKKEHGEAADIAVADTTGNYTKPVEDEYKQLEKVIADIYDKINGIAGGEGDYSLNSLKAAIDILNGNTSTTGSVAKAVADEASRIDAITGTPDSGKTLQGEIDDIESAVATLNGNSSTTGSVAKAVADEASRIDAITGTPDTNMTLQGEIDAVESAITTLNSDASTTGSVAKTVNDAITALNLSTTYAGKTYETKVDALIGDDAEKSVRTIANEELAAQLIPANATESLDTLQEIAAWIQAHPGDASAMNAAITALQTKVTLGMHEVEGEQVEYTTVKAYVEAAIAALNIGNYALATDLITLAGRVTTAEGDIDTLETAMTTAENDIDTLETTVDGLDGRLDTAEADITTLKGDNTTAGSVAKTVKDAIDALDYSVAANGQNETNKVLTGFTIANGALVDNSVTTATFAAVAFTGNATDLTTGANDYIELFGGTAGSGWTDPTVATP